ncbi:MAG: colicin [Bacteroidetes bacterium]|nr:colicin [Bacteroidota bacterium]
MKQEFNSILDIKLSLQIALLGEVYPALRMVVFKFDKENKLFLLRYYLDREPREADYENISIVSAEATSLFEITIFEILKEECIYSDKPHGKLDPLDGVVYARKEYELEELL